MITADMRHENRKEIFDIVRRRREVTRADLQEETGYSGPFIMKITNEFIDMGILKMVGKKSDTAAGRKPFIMAFNPNIFLSIGIEFAGSYLLAGIVNLDGEIQWQTRQKIENTGVSEITDAIEKAVDRLLRTADSEGITCSAIGIGFPGSISEDHLAIRTNGTFGSHLIDISEAFERMRKKYSIPIYIENDVNARAVGEYFINSGTGSESDFLFVLYSEFGLGGGMILNGKLRRGPHFQTGEIGSSVINTETEVKLGTKGWLEQQITRQAMEEFLKNHAESGEVSDEWIDFAARSMAPFIANIVNSVDLNRVVLAGGMCEICGEKLLDRLNEYLVKLTFYRVKAVPASSEYSGVVGSALQASNNLCDVLL